MQHSKKLFRITPANSVFFECDIQEKFTKHVQSGATVIHNAKRLALTAKLFKIPIFSTQQIPRIFGITEKVIKDVYDSYPEGSNVYDKTDFSMLEAPLWERLQTMPDRKKIVLYGIEAHVCVKQTCFELLMKDYDVTLVVDAISSMSYHDRTPAIEAMRDAGAQITTYQSLVFELAKNPSIPEYKDLLKLIKDQPAEQLHLHQMKL